MQTRTINVNNLYVNAQSGKKYQLKKDDIINITTDKDEKGNAHFTNCSCNLGKDKRDTLLLDSDSLFFFTKSI